VSCVGWLVVVCCGVVAGEWVVGVWGRCWVWVGFDVGVLSGWVGFGVLVGFCVGGGGGGGAYLYMISIDVIIFLVNKLHPCLVNCNVEKGE